MTFRTRFEAHQRLTRETANDGPPDAPEAAREPRRLGQIVMLNHMTGHGELFSGSTRFVFEARDFLRRAEFVACLAGDYVTFEPDGVQARAIGRA